MILNGNQRGGARDLARHLMKPENEHIEVHQIRGFVADTLAGAFLEAEAISRGTKCRQFLYSLSLSPPEAAYVPVAVFEDAIDRIEEKLGLSGHPRVIVFHEKQGRRHAHCVWSRIDSNSMTAVRLSHDRKKLTDISRELFFEQGWKMPEGLIDPELRNPLNFDRQEWFKAKRTGKDPRDIKKAFQQCWAASDSAKAFGNALEQRGYYLAQGDRRAAVAIDLDGEVYAIARWTGLRTKQVIARIGDPSSLPTVAQTLEKIGSLVQEKMSGFANAVHSEFEKAANDLEARRIAMVKKHRSERAALDQSHEARCQLEAKQRAERFRKGLAGLWDRVTGKHARLRLRNEMEAETGRRRDTSERDAVVFAQLKERQALQQAIIRERKLHTLSLARIHRIQKDGQAKLTNSHNIANASNASSRRERERYQNTQRRHRRPDP